MEKLEKSDRGGGGGGGKEEEEKEEERELLLRWGNRKKLRCVRPRDSDPSYVAGGRIRRRNVSTSSPFSPSGSTRNLEAETVRRRYSPEKGDGGGGGSGGVGEEEKKKGVVVWPKLYTALSSKEKEEDYMAMKGCKLPHRPKKRSKLIQRTLLLVSPGAWLSELCQERYEVRERKTSKKRPRGLKAMGSLESDSE